MGVEAELDWHGEIYPRVIGSISEFAGGAEVTWWGPRRYNLFARVVVLVTCRSRTDGVKSVGGPPMQQIADWLQKLGLGQYAQRFVENDIDVSVLRHLTDADLEKIGVTLGHRRGPMWCQQYPIDMFQRRTMTCVSAPPHAARLRRKLSRPKLTVIAELAADFALGQNFSAVAAFALRRIPQAVAPATCEPRFKIVERTDASTTERTLQSDPLTYGAAACPDQWHDNGATVDKLEFERARIEPHHAQPWISNVGAKYRAHRVRKNILADQFAHVERYRAIVFDSAIAFRFWVKHAARQSLAC
jgi:SAM domain (Sterile alpha motif)